MDLLEFPQTAPVSKLNQEHPEFARHREIWEQIRTLYKGGVDIRAAVLFPQADEREARETAGQNRTSAEPSAGPPRDQHGEKS